MRSPVWAVRAWWLFSFCRGRVFAGSGRRLGQGKKIRAHVLLVHFAIVCELFCCARSDFAGSPRVVFCCSRQCGVSQRSGTGPAFRSSPILGGSFVVVGIGFFSMAAFGILQVMVSVLVCSGGTCLSVSSAARVVLRGDSVAWPLLLEARGVGGCLICLFVRVSCSLFAVCLFLFCPGHGRHPMRGTSMGLIAGCHVLFYGLGCWCCGVKMRVCFIWHLIETYAVNMVLGFSCLLRRLHVCCWRIREVFVPCFMRRSMLMRCNSVTVGILWQIVAGMVEAVCLVARLNVGV